LCRRQAEGRVDDFTIETLRRAYEHDAEPLLDFTTCPEAQAAQVEHVIGCKHCREKYAKVATEEVPPSQRETALRANLHEKLAAAIAIARGGIEARDAVTVALVDAVIALDTEDMAAAYKEMEENATNPILKQAMAIEATMAPDRFRGLKIELALFFQAHGSAAVLCTLAATKEERLGRKLNEHGVAPAYRKLPRIVLSAVIAALKQDTSVLCPIPIRDLASATDLNVAMTLAVLKPPHSLTPSDCEAAGEMWKETLTRDGGAKYTNEVVKAQGASQRRRYDSGLKVLQLMVMLQWAADMQLIDAADAYDVMGNEGETKDRRWHGPRHHEVPSHNPTTRHLSNIDVAAEIVGHAQRCIFAFERFSLQVCRRCP
jgi:hypothetical protein